MIFSGVTSVIRAADEKFPLGIFGEEAHRYVLNSVLRADVLDRFEAEWDLTLPPDYREFLTTVGNGGAGPYYGLFKFHEMDSGWSHRRFSIPGDTVGNPGKPFPYTEAFVPENGRPDYDPDIEDEDQADQDYQKRLDEHEAKYWIAMDGALPICHLGCASRQWLVVSGPERGNIWDDNTADYSGYKPLAGANGERCTFTDWYMQWLSEVEAAL